MDVIAMHQAGFNMAAASLGTAFTGGQANLLRRYAKEVILAYDSDGAGVNAAMRAISILKETGIPAKVLNMEPYKDPDEFIKALGKEEFEKRIENAENSFFYELRIISRDYDLKDPEGKTRFYREIARKLCEFSEEVERENYIEAVCEKYNIGFDSLRKLVLGYAAANGDVPVRAEKPKSGINSKTTHEDNVKKPQQLFLTWIIEEPSLYPRIKKYVTPEDFTLDIYKRAAKRLFEEIDKGSTDPAGIISMFTEEEEQTEVAKLFNTHLTDIGSGREKEKAFKEIFIKLKKNSYEYLSEHSGSDADALTRAVEGKRLLEELNKLRIDFE